MIDLNDDSFLLYCAKTYDSPHMILSELEEDLKRIKYIKRLIKKYKATGELKTRLILNHIVILTNVFGPEGCVRILFFKIEPKYYDVLKTFFLYINILPEVVQSINSINIKTSLIPVDLNVANELRNL